MSDNSNNNDGSNNAGSNDAGFGNTGAPSRRGRSNPQWTLAENQTLLALVQANGTGTQPWQGIADTMNATYGTNRTALSMRTHHADIIRSTPNIELAPLTRQNILSNADFTLIAGERAQEKPWSTIMSEHFSDRGITRSGMAKAYSRWQARGAPTDTSGATSQASANVVQPPPENAFQSSFQLTGYVPIAPAPPQVPGTSDDATVAPTSAPASAPAPAPVPAPATTDAPAPAPADAPAPTAAPIPTLTIDPAAPLSSSLVPVASPTAPSPIHPSAGLTLPELDWIRYMRETGHTWADIAGSPDLAARGYAPDTVREEFTMWVHVMIRQATGMLGLTTPDVPAISAARIQELDDLFADPDMAALLSTSGPPPASQPVVQPVKQPVEQPTVQPAGPPADPPQDTQAEAQGVAQLTGTVDPALPALSQDNYEELFGTDNQLAVSDDQLRSFLESSVRDETWGEYEPGAFEQGDLYGSD